MKRLEVTKAELSKLDRLMAKRGFQKTENRFYNPGTKMSVALIEGNIVFSYRSELTDVKSVREFVKQNTKTRKAKSKQKGAK